MPHIHSSERKTNYFRRGALLVVLTLLLFAAVAAGLGMGSAPLSLAQVWGGLWGIEGFETERIILQTVRLPRVIGGLFCGIGLSVSGVLLQAVTNNALASPNIIGINAGAGFLVILLSCFFPAAFSALPAAAFAGAFLTALLIITVSHRMNSSKITVILAGMACNAILNAGISFLSLLYPDVYASYRYFSVGGLSGVPMNRIILPAAIILVCAAGAQALSSKINLLCIGDSMASSLGVRVRRLRMACLVFASASAAGVVSFAGLLGFVGLIVPHIARRIVGGNVSWLLPVSALGGAILVIVSDLLGRVLFAPSELPVGIVLSLIGAPFFLVLLLKRRTEL